MKKTALFLALAAMIGFGTVVPQKAEAAGCIKGALVGGVAGNMAHHTFLGAIGGCAGGMVVSHMYKSWKEKHPQGTLKDFVAENKEKFPAGFDTGSLESAVGVR